MNTPQQKTKLLSIKEVMNYIPVSRRAIEYLIADGRLPSVTIGRRRFVDQRDLTAFIDSLRDGAVSAARPFSVK